MRKVEFSTQTALSYHTEPYLLNLNSEGQTDPILYAQTGSLPWRRHVGAWWLHDKRNKYETDLGGLCMLDRTGGATC